MTSKQQPNEIMSAPAIIERLESRAYMSATPTAAGTGALVHAASGIRVAHSRVLSPSKVVPVVDLTARSEGIVKRNINGKYIVPQVLITNAGPDTAKGSLRISVEFSYYNTGAGARLFRTVNTPIKIVAGGTKTVKIGGYIPKSFPTFDYHMVVIINGKKSIPETNYSNDTQVTASYFYLA